MRKGLLILLFAVPLCGADAIAAFTGARATPRQAQLVGSADNVVAITWRISTTSDHVTGVTSPFTALVDPSSREPLQAVTTTFDAGGAGPFTFREVLRIDAALVRAWADRGTRRVVLERTFGDAAGNSVNASVVLSISRSRLQAGRDAAPSKLSVSALRLEFESGNNSAITTLDQSLRSTLTVQYTGSGVLHGRWQIAEPESPGELPVFRTLALVNRNLVTSQRSTLHSPELPTQRSGRYVLRFCVTSEEPAAPSGDTQCPDAGLVATATYFVQGLDSRSVAVIRNLSPNRQVAGPGTVFSWGSVSGVQVYQLQVLALAPAGADLPSSRVESDRIEPRFVTGMLLDSATSETTLSDLVRNRLENGQRYLWRVTAHDEKGHTIGTSTEASFVYSDTN